MSLIDWTKILPKDLGARVIYSSLCRSDAPPKGRTQLVTIWLPGDFYIDVEWNRRDGYLVTLVHENFCNAIDQKAYSDVASVISCVATFADRQLPSLHQ